VPCLFGKSKNATIHKEFAKPLTQKNSTHKKRGLESAAHKKDDVLVLQIPKPSEAGRIGRQNLRKYAGQASY
jgi:hypothetical protein